MARDNDVELRVSVDPGSSKSNVDQLADSMQGLGTAAKPVADALKNTEAAGMAWARAAEAAGDSTEETAARYDDFRGTVEQLRARIVETYGAMENAPTDVRATFDGLTKALSGTAAAYGEIEKKFAGIPEGIEKIRNMGDKTFEEQRKLLEAVSKEIDKQGDGYRKLGDDGQAGLRRVEVETARVARAMDDLSKEASSSSGRIRDGIIQTERQFEKFSNTLRDNPKEGLEQLPRVAGAVIQLRQEIQRAQQAGGPVDPVAITRLRQFETELEGAKNQARNLKLEIDKATAGTTNASQAWMGFDAIVNQVAGSFGKMGIAVVGGFAALKEGWQIGTQVAKAIGTDFSAAEAAAASLKKGLGSITNALTTDGFSAAFTQAIAVTKTFGDTVTGSGKQIDGYNAIVQAGVDRGKALKLTTEELAAAADTHRIAVDGGTETLKQWNAVVNGTDPAELGGRLESLKGWFSQLAEEEKKAKEELEKLNTAKDDYVKKIDDTIAAMLKERVARREGLDAVTDEMTEIQRLMDQAKEANELRENATKVQGGSNEALRHEVEIMRQLIGEREVATGQLDVYAAGLAKTVSEYKDGLTPAQEASYEELIKLAKSYGTLDEAGRARLKALADEIAAWGAASAAVGSAKIRYDELTGTYTNVAEGARDLERDTSRAGVAVKTASDAAKESTVKWDEATRSMTTAGESIDRAKGHVTLFGDSVVIAGGKIADFDKILDHLTTKMDIAATKARELATAIRDTGVAAAEAAVSEKAAAPQPAAPPRTAAPRERDNTRPPGLPTMP